VPSDTYEATFEYLKTLGEVTNENESRENVTDSYIEVESRMKAKLTEEARLIELLAKAETVNRLRHIARIRTTEMSFDVAFISVLLLYRKIKSYEFEISSQRQIAPFSVVCQ